MHNLIPHFFSNNMLKRLAGQMQLLQWRKCPHIHSRALMKPERKINICLIEKTKFRNHSRDQRITEAKDKDDKCAQCFLETERGNEMLAGTNSFQANRWTVHVFWDDSFSGGWGAFDPVWKWQECDRETTDSQTKGLERTSLLKFPDLPFPVPEVCSYSPDDCSTWYNIVPTELDLFLAAVSASF